MKRAKATALTFSAIISVIAMCSSSWIDIAEPLSPPERTFGAEISKPSEGCVAISCRSKSESCARGGETCLVPFVCIEGVCSSSRRLNEKCASPIECNSADLVVNDRTCSPQGLCKKVLQEGEPCEDQANSCDVGMKCQGGFCTAVGAVLGEQCNVDVGCRRPLSCQSSGGTSVCVGLSSKNQSCSSVRHCDVGLDCINNRCVPEFSAARNAECSQRACSPPFVCSRNGTCVSPRSKVWQDITCSSDSQCPEDSSCLCDWESGKRRCTVMRAPSWSSLVIHKEMLSCIKGNGYDRRQCYDKILSWLQATWTANRRMAPVPELYCLLGTSSATFPSTVAVLLALVMTTV